MRLSDVKGQWKYHGMFECDLGRSLSAKIQWLGSGLGTSDFPLHPTRPLLNIKQVQVRQCDPTQLERLSETRSGFMERWFIDGLASFAAHANVYECGMDTVARCAFLFLLLQFMNPKQPFKSQLNPVSDTFLASLASIQSHRLGCPSSMPRDSHESCALAECVPSAHKECVSCSSHEIHLSCVVVIRNRCCKSVCML